MKSWQKRVDFLSIKVENCTISEFSPVLQGFLGASSFGGLSIFLPSFDEKKQPKQTGGCSQGYKLYSSPMPVCLGLSEV